MESKIYNQTGEEMGSIKLPEKVFDIAWQEDLVHDVVTSMMANKRNQTAHSKDRGEVRGGGKKPWQQKGTGRARHGSIRSPIWVGGGVAHGPTKDKVYHKKINKKQKAKALYMVLSRKFKENEILFVDSLNGLNEIKTSEAKKILNNLGKVSGFAEMPKKKKNSAIIALEGRSNNVEKSFRNFNNIVTEQLKNLNPVILLNYKFLIIVNPELALGQISGKV